MMVFKTEARNNVITEEGLIALLLAYYADIWVGEIGHGSLPWANDYDGGRYVPVAQTVGYADGRPNEEIPANEAEIVECVREAHKIIVDDWHGCHRAGSYMFNRKKGGGKWFDVVWHDGVD